MEQTVTLPRQEPRTERSTEQPRLWNVVLLDDQEHSYEYVVAMVQALFGHSFEKAFQITKAVDSEGRAVCKTTHRELAELKVEQIRGFGPDRFIAASRTSMRALIEPAECGGEDDHHPRA
ncbi:MAG TPA: Clp protease ClpS [Phycisphaerales bacterium]|nr:Clp protease ClpS [Phycisphaerales bacterium]